ILELPLRRNRRLIFFELRRLDNQPFCRLDIHVAEIEHQVVAARITPVRAKHRHQPPAAHFFGLLEGTASFNWAQVFTALDLVDTDFSRSGEQHFQHMADAGQQFVTEVAVIDDLSVSGNFTKRSLKSDAVGTHVLQQPFPPVRTFFHDLVELRFGNSVAPAGHEKLRSADTTVAQNAGNSFRQFLATARCALINGDDRHEKIPSYRGGSGPAPENFLSNSKISASRGMSRIPRDNSASRPRRLNPFKPLKPFNPHLCPPPRCEGGLRRGN